MISWQEALLGLAGLAFFVVFVFVLAGAAAGSFRRGRRPRDRRPGRRD